MDIYASAWPIELRMQTFMLQCDPQDEDMRTQTSLKTLFLVSHAFLRHGGPPPKALHQSGLTMGKVSIHGEPKFSEGQPRVFTNQVRVKTLHELVSHASLWPLD